MISIREALEEDLFHIHLIERDVYPAPWSFSFFNLMLQLSKDLFLVATEKDEIVGYCVGDVEKMGKKGSQLLIGHLMNVAVTKKHQRKGIGSMLLDEIEKRFAEKEAESAYLEVRVSNEVAQNMYNKRGYQYIRTSKGYYGDEDGIIMMKSLTR